MGPTIKVTKSILKTVYKPRQPWAQKYDYGHLLVIGGSKLYTGSPILSSMAALRSGVDLVTIITVERAADVAAIYSPNLIAYPLKGNFLNRSHLPEIAKFIKNKDAVVIGGGLWRQTPVLDAVQSLVRRLDRPTVIDADAIYAVAEDKKVLGGGEFLLTPNEREFKVLCGNTPSKKIEERVEMVSKCAKEIGQVVLLKGHVDVISDGKKSAINTTGNPYMTVGGMGDTLAGICGSLIAQGNSIFDSACAAAFINGRAGDIAAKELRQGVLATDLVESIPKAIKA
jgi:ADP-dependent NAD(P)H-hydrate dehydratase / NAD(P)H-hydrate epimerase